MTSHLPLSTEIHDVILSDSTPTPDDELPLSFHTPRHLIHTPVPSQDSLEIFHDAPLAAESHSLLNNIKHTMSNGTIHHQLSSSACALSSACQSPHDAENPEDCNENTCMLSDGLEKSRVRHWSSGPASSRSCNSSPLHKGHLKALSVNSLRKTIKEGLIGADSTPKCPSTMADSIPSGYVPCVEAVVRDIGSSGAPPSTLSRSHPSLRGSHNHCSEQEYTAPAWMSNYVACVEMSKYSNGQAKRECIAEVLEADWKKEQAQSSTSDIQQTLNRRKSFSRVKDEFRGRNVQLNHPCGHLFVTSQWQHPGEMSCLYLGYRLFWGLYFVMWAVWSLLATKGYLTPITEKCIYFVYFFHWGIWLLAVDTFLQALNIMLHLKKMSVDGDFRYQRQPCRLKFSWFLSNMSTSIVVLNTIVYWAVIYRADPISSLLVNLYIIPCIYVVLDSFISATPKRVFHAYMPMIFGVLYMAFTLVYFLIGGKNEHGELSLYPLLDWRKPAQSSVACLFGILVVIPMIHFGLCILSALKLKIWGCVKHSRSSKRMSCRESFNLSTEAKV